MRRLFAILLLLATLLGWWQMRGEAQACTCACCAQVQGGGACPCGCEDEKTTWESMPLCPVDSPEAVEVPDGRTPIPPVACREMTRAELLLARAVWLRLPVHPPPGARAGGAYAGFPTPMRA